jgi:putative transposase
VAQRPLRIVQESRFGKLTATVSCRAIDRQGQNEFPTWGAPKIRERPHTHYPELSLPAKSTVHGVLDRHGLLKKKRARRHPKLSGTQLSDLKEPNALWRVDYKGEFMLGNHQYSYSLTVTDYTSHYLICCEGLESAREAQAFTVFEKLFREYGLPGSISSENGVPFACANALYGLNSLSVWWLRLGIGIERIKLGNLQQNGRHERIHLTLKQAMTKLPAKHFYNSKTSLKTLSRSATMSGLIKPWK